MQKILFINHSGTFGGAQRSMLELINRIRKEKIEITVATPRGNIVKVLSDLGINTITLRDFSKFDHSAYGYYRGLRWLILMRELFFIFPTLWFFYKNRKTVREHDIVHCNEITLVLPLIIAKKWFGKTTVLHARTRYHKDPKLWRTGWLNKIYSKYADRIIAIDETVANTFPLKNNIEVVHNSFSANGELNNLNKDSFGLDAGRKSKLVLGFVGTLVPHKGAGELVEAVNLAVKESMDVSLLLIGSLKSRRSKLMNAVLKMIGMTHDVNKTLIDYIQENGLEDVVRPLGFTTRLAEFYDHIDVICFPTHDDALGRPVFEAAFFKKPSIVTIRTVFNDTFIKDETGVMATPRDANSIFEAIRFYYNNPQRKIAMGEKAYQLAIDNFDPAKNAESVMKIYQSLN